MGNSIDKEEVIESLVRDGYSRHPEFNQSILIVKGTDAVISSDEHKWYHYYKEIGSWAISDAHYDRYLSCDEYIKKCCDIKIIDGVKIPVYRIKNETVN
jgi:hypothetical protein